MFKRGSLVDPETAKKADSKCKYLKTDVRKMPGHHPFPKSLLTETLLEGWEMIDLNLMGASSPSPPPTPSQKQDLCRVLLELQARSWLGLATLRPHTCERGSAVGPAVLHACPDRVPCGSLKQWLHSLRTVSAAVLGLGAPLGQ